MMNSLESEKESILVSMSQDDVRETLLKVSMVLLSAVRERMKRTESCRIQRWREHC